jgi:hypothetical protein
MTSFFKIAFFTDCVDGGSPKADKFGLDIADADQSFLEFDDVVVTDSEVFLEDLLDELEVFGFVGPNGTSRGGIDVRFVFVE